MSSCLNVCSQQAFIVLDVDLNGNTMEDCTFHYCLACLPSFYPFWPLNEETFNFSSKQRGEVAGFEKSADSRFCFRILHLDASSFKTTLNPLS